MTKAVMMVTMTVIADDARWETSLIALIFPISKKKLVEFFFSNTSIYEKHPSHDQIKPNKT